MTCSWSDLSKLGCFARSWPFTLDAVPLSVASRALPPASATLFAAHGVKVLHG